MHKKSAGRNSSRLALGVTEALESRVLFSESALSIVPHISPLPLPQVSSAPASTIGTGINSEYFIGDDFQTPVSVNTDPRIDFNWKYGRPVAAVPAGVFSAKWTGLIDPKTSSTYTFFTDADSGSRVIIDGSTVIDNFSSRVKAVSSGSIALSAGVPVSIEVDYVSRGASTAFMQLLWSSSSFSKRLVPQSVLTPAAASLPPEPLTATYYLGENFNMQVLTEAEPAVHFNLRPTVPDALIPDGDSFSVQWSGTVVAPVTGNYVFKTITDDGVRLFIDGVLKIQHWKDESSTTYETVVPLTAGQSYDIAMQYYDNGIGAGIAKLLWKVPGAKSSSYLPFSSPIPVSPADVSATPFSSYQIGLTWSDVPGETGFIIERSSDGGATFSQIGTTAGGVTMFDDTGLTAVTNYEYEVIAVNAAGDSPASAPASATTLQLVAPPAVTASATASGTTATISWTASPTATSYLVQRSTDSSNWTDIATTSSTMLQDTGLGGGATTTFYYRVIASNAAGSSAPSNDVFVTIVPAAPTNLTETVASASEIDLSWNFVPGAITFTIEDSTNGTTGWTPIGTASVVFTSFRAGGLSPATTYYFEVVANNGGGASSPSNVVHGTTSAANPTYASLTTIYGLTGAGTVYSIDTSTGAATQIGAMLFGTNASARDPLTGNLFYISAGTSTVEIAEWNPNDGANTVVNASVPLGNPVAQAAFRADGDGFLTTDVGQLFEFDDVNAVATLMGVIHANGSVLDIGNGDMAFAPDDTLYVETNSELYSISNAAVNAANGGGSVLNATDLGPTNTPNLQIAFGQNGVLYGTSGTGQLYTLNLSNGAATAVGSPSGVDMGDLASIPLYGELSVAQSSSTFEQGTTGSYTLTVSNAGPDTTVGPITLVDTLPAGITFVSESGTGWTFIASGSTITMTYIPNVAAGTSAPPVTLQVAVSSNLPLAPVSNTVSASTTEFQTDTAMNTDTFSSEVYF